MNPNMAQTLVWDHIRDLRQQAAARQAGAARDARRRTGARVARRGHRLVREA